MDPIFYGKPLTFNEKSHRYTWDGQPVRSVTTILGVLAKPMLIPWAANMVAEHIKTNCHENNGAYLVTETELEAARTAHSKRKTDAGDAGREVHQYAEDILKGKVPAKSQNQEVIRGCAAFEGFMRKHKLEPIDVERRIFSKKLNYAGTTDFYGHVDGRLGILDFKTSSGVYDEFWLQTAGYEEAIVEELFEPGSDHLWRFLVHLDKSTGEFKLYSRAFDPLHREAWINCVALDRITQAMKKIASEEKKAAKAA